MVIFLLPQRHYAVCLAAVGGAESRFNNQLPLLEKNY